MSANRDRKEVLCLTNFINSNRWNRCRGL